MNIISIGSDRNLFKEGSAVRERTLRYATLTKEFHIIVFSLASLRLERIHIAPNIWIYPTNSNSKWRYIVDAIRIGKKIITERNFTASDSLVTVQDPFEAGIVGWMLKNTGKVKLHVQIHTDFFNPYFVEHSVFNKIRVMIAKRVLPRADAIRVVSRRVSNSLARLMRHVPPVSVLPIVVDVQKTTPGVTFDLHEKYPQFESIVLMVCRLEPEKDVRSAFAMMRNVLKKHPKAGLVIVGEGSARASLTELSKEMGIEGCVMFEGWQHELTSYYKTADIFLGTSLYEGYGLSLIEAALSRSAIVTSDVGIAGEVLIDGESAAIYPVHDATAGAEKIIDLLGDTDKRRRFGECAYTAAGKHVMTPEEYVERYKESWHTALLSK